VANPKNKLRVSPQAQFFVLATIPLGLVLVLATTGFQEEINLSSELQSPTPTVDFRRLDQPTLPANPSQADQGAVDFWLSCMACHGDVGQGLTDEFRTLYPPEEENCWQSGCHGKNPYEDGFTLPTAIPAIIGPSAALDKFSDAAVLHAFTSAAMPWHNPGSLDSEIYWRLTAFLLRENGYENPYAELGSDNASFVLVGGALAEISTEQATQTTPHPTLAADDEAGKQLHPPVGIERNWWIGVLLIAVLIISLAVLARRRR
jgi:hypothetical protein